MSIQVIKIKKLLFAITLVISISKAFGQSKPDNSKQDINLKKNKKEHKSLYAIDIYNTIIKKPPRDSLEEAKK